MPHGFIEARKLRLDLWNVTFASVFEAACASTAFANECFNEHDRGPLEHPMSPGERLGRLPRSIGSCLSIADNRRRYAGSGVENPSLDTPHRDCSRQGLRPNPDRSGHLVSRRPIFALSGETRRKKGIAGVAPTCTAGATQRVVRRSISAKKPDAHQPEVPSIMRPPRRVGDLIEQRWPLDGHRCLFHLAALARGTPVRALRDPAFD
jgi:hypothetical protein